MGGSLTPEETPGGGLTLVVALEAAQPRGLMDAAGQPGRRERAGVVDGSVRPADAKRA